MMALDGWFGNSVNHWRDELAARKRRLEIQAERALTQDRKDNIEGLQKINERMIMALDRAYSDVLRKASEPAQSEGK